MPDDPTMPMPVTVSTADEWLSDADRFSGEWQGAARGSGICVIANHIDAPGAGAKAHQHPYPETFVIRKGNARFTIGDRTLVCGAGQIVVVPAGVPHEFCNHGPGPLEMIDIHESGAFDTTWIE